MKTNFRDFMFMGHAIKLAALDFTTTTGIVAKQCQMKDADFCTRKAGKVTFYKIVSDVTVKQVFNYPSFHDSELRARKLFGSIVRELFPTLFTTKLNKITKVTEKNQYDLILDIFEDCKTYDEASMGLVTNQRLNEERINQLLEKYRILDEYMKMLHKDRPSIIVDEAVS